VEKFRFITMACRGRKKKRKGGKKCIALLPPKKKRETKGLVFAKKRVGTGKRREKEGRVTFAAGGK